MATESTQASSQMVGTIYVQYCENCKLITRQPEGLKNNKYWHLFEDKISYYKDGVSFKQLPSGMTSLNPTGNSTWDVYLIKQTGKMFLFANGNARALRDNTINIHTCK